MASYTVQDRPVMRQQLRLQRTAPPAVSVSSLTRTSTTATVTTATPHGYATNDYVTIAGATGATTGYNGKWQITVTGASTFTFTVGALATPATGTITVTYTSDAQGGRSLTWQTFATVRAELVPISSTERVQLAAIQSNTLYRFRTRTRPDVTPAMRMCWTPSWPPAATPRTLAITGVLPDGEGRFWMVLEAAESSS